MKYNSLCINYLEKNIYLRQSVVELLILKIFISLIFYVEPKRCFMRKIKCVFSAAVSIENFHVWYNIYM